MHRRGTGPAPAVSVLVPVLDPRDLDGLRRRVGALSASLARTVASFEIVVVLDGLPDDPLGESLPPGVLVRRRARRGGRRVALLEAVHLSSGVVLVVVEGRALLDDARLRSLLNLIKGGVDLVTGVDVAPTAGALARQVARGVAWVRGRFGLSGGLRAFRRHARVAALVGPRPWRAAASRFAAVAV